MCPSAPVALPLDSIDVNWSDEELISFLGRRRIGDPIPSNVITEVNPFSLDPRNSPEGIWFLYNSKDSQSYDEGSVIKVTNGYWRSMDGLQILTNTHNVGRKTIREFYVGQAPSGNRTGWMMHEYWSEQIASQINNKSREKITLCRFSLQNSERSDNGGQCDPLIADAGDDIESMLPGFLEQEEISPSLGVAADGSQMVGENEPRQQELASGYLENSVNENPFPMEGEQEGYDFSKEDFLELKDLYEPESSSSSSDNSSVASMNSDDCFDADALLRDIENEGVRNMEERVDHNFNVATPIQSHRVVIRPPSPAIGNTSNLVVGDNGPTNPIPIPNPAIPSPAAEPQRDSDASISVSSQGSHESHGSTSPQDGSTSKRSRSRSVRRMAKFGKRYCCFRSF